MKIGKRLGAVLLALTLAVLIVPMPVQAAEVSDSGSCGELTWQLDSEGVLTISGSGAMPDFYYGLVPWWRHTRKISRVLLEPGVTAIGANAFADCEKLTDLDIAETVTSIGKGAFFSCDALEMVTIPEGVAQIGERAFYNCDALRAVFLGSGVESIGDGAFFACGNLTGIWVDAGNPHYKSDSAGVLFSEGGKVLLQAPGGLSGSYGVPKGVLRIEKYALAYCAKLTGVTISDTVTEIGEGAFCGCTKLTSVAFPASVEKIGTSAFYLCGSLEKITFEGAAPEIGFDTFALLSLTAYYPECAGESWDEEARGNYGGNITWIAIPTHFDADGDKVCDACAAVLHTAGEPVTENQVAATCTEPGSFDLVVYCTDCGAELSRETTAVEATGHTMVRGEAIGPTCTEPGLTAGTHCEVCGYEGLPQLEVPAPGHMYLPAITVPTCTEPGYTTYKCIACDESYVDHHTDPTGHTPGRPVREENSENGTCMLVTSCIRCGAELSRVMEGDVDADGDVDVDDAIYLLYHVLVGEPDYPVNQDCDFDGSGAVDVDDAIYLLYHVLMGADAYPL